MVQQLEQTQNPLARKDIHQIVDHWSLEAGGARLDMGIIEMEARHLERRHRRTHVPELVDS